MDTSWSSSLHYSSVTDAMPGTLPEKNQETSVYSERSFIQIVEIWTRLLLQKTIWQVFSTISIKNWPISFVKKKGFPFEMNTNQNNRRGTEKREQGMALAIICSQNNENTERHLPG